MSAVTTNLSRIVLFSALVLAVLHTAARAQSSSAQISVSKENVSSSSSAKKWGLTAVLTQSTNLEESSSRTDETSTTLELLPTFRLSSKSTLRVYTPIENNNSTNETLLLNTVVSFLRDPIVLNSSNKLNLELKALLPTDEAAREEQSLQGALGFVASVRHQLKTSRPSSISYGLDAYKFSHEFDRSNSRTANISHRLRHIVSYDLGLTQKLALNLKGYYQTGFTYQNVIKETFLLEQSLDYSLNTNLAFGLSHSNQGALFEKNGADFNASFYDSRDSSISAYVTFIY